MAIEIIDLGIQELDVYDIETENTNMFFGNDILLHNSIYVTLDGLVNKVFPDAKDLAKTNPIKIVNFIDKACKTKIQPFIDSMYLRLADYTNAYAQKMIMKREKICFEPHVKIETDKGRVAIANIKPGDMVLTHKNRYRKVLQVYKNRYEGELIHIQYGRTHEYQHVRATPDHPILVERDGVKEWFAFSDVKENDCIFVLPKICPETQRLIPYWCEKHNTWNAIQDNQENDDNGFIKVKVLYTKRVSINRPYNKKEINVYNIEVEEDNSYVAARTVVHNCDQGICVGAKNYIWNVWDSEGVRYEKPKLSIVGLSMIKSKTPEIARNELRKVVPYIIADEQKILQDFIKEFRKKFNETQPEDVAVPTSMKGLYEYADQKNIYKKGTPIHVRAALLYNHYLKEKGLTKQYPLIQDGEKIKYSYLKLPNPIKEDVIGFPTILPPELGLHKYIDYDIQFEKAVVSPLKAVLDVVGWTIEEQSTFDNFWE